MKFITAARVLLRSISRNPDGKSSATTRNVCNVAAAGATSTMDRISRVSSATVFVSQRAGTVSANQVLGSIPRVPGTPVMTRSNPSGPSGRVDLHYFRGCGVGD